MEIGVRKTKTKDRADRVEVVFRNKDEKDMEWKRPNGVQGVEGTPGVWSEGCRWGRRKMKLEYEEAE